MTVMLEGPKSFVLASAAQLLPDDREIAWAERTLKPSPAYKYVLGRYVESDRANENKQMWPLEELRAAKDTIIHSPLNLLHSAKIVGHFADSELIYPTEDAGMNPYVEALAVYYKYFFPTDLAMIENAYSSGLLAFSMECISETITCIGDQACGKTFPYEGPQSPNYCHEINSRVSTKQLNKPHFLAGALIYPPAKPGWSKADVKELSTFVQEREMEAAALYSGLQEELPDADAKAWEWMMSRLIEQAKDFSDPKRKKLAKEGKAMGGGGFPIESVSDLKNAIQAIGRAKNPAAARAHIKKRAKALGASNLIPKDW